MATNQLLDADKIGLGMKERTIDTKSDAAEHQLMVLREWDSNSRILPV
jgi:hypothetical protein